MGLHLIVCWSLMCAVVGGYNLDTSSRVIFPSEAGNYFGYTVALHKNREGSLAIVGAPRANSSVVELHQPGVLFKCSIPAYNTEPKCTEIKLDPRGNKRSIVDGFSYYEHKDNMWIGVSLDIQNGTSNNHIVTCGHRWMNQYFSNYHLLNGACYVIDENLDQDGVEKLLPLIQTAKQGGPPGEYNFAFGQAGAAATFSEDGRELLLGSPGIKDWAGSVVSYSSDENNPDDSYKRAMTPKPLAGLANDSYFGYSVTSGKFYDNYELFYAVGAPRGNSNLGQVYIFKASETKESQLSVHQKKEGSQFGEYFGASVLGMNLNGDDFTDLLVGGPLFAEPNGIEEGKVYVYISNGVGLLPYAELIGDSKPNSRFGTAIANVGDLNQDGFNDVAIGAPYEDGKGAIYIYHGSEVGMKVQYVQKIEAAKIDSQLSGFGIHISRGLDIDNNSYPDILVGSYASSNAVLFRTRPVVQLFSKLLFTPQQINMNVSNCEFDGNTHPCVDVVACLRYTGKHLDGSLDFDYELHAEPPGQSNVAPPRGFFVENGRPTPVLTKNITLDVDREECRKYTFYVRPDILNVITPIQILFGYRLAEPVDGASSFNKLFPVTDPSMPMNITSSITFQTGCGRDDVCLSDLIVSGTFLGVARRGHLVIGEVPSLSLSITVKNKGEAAHLSRLLIHLPADVSSINQDICDTGGRNSNASLTCDLGNPLLENEEVKMIIKLDVSKIPVTLKSLDIFLEARTVSTEIAPENNNVSMSLPLQALAEIDITGTSIQEQFFYDEDDEIDLPVPLIHTYNVKNHGPSPVEFVDILLLVPVSFVKEDSQMKFLTFTGLEVDTGKQLMIPAKCNDTYLDVKNKTDVQKLLGDKWLELDKDNTTRMYNGSKDKENSTDVVVNTEDDLLVTEESTTRTKMGSPKTRDTIIINCKSENVKCIAIQCTASPFTDIRKISQITIEAEIDINVLNMYLGPWYRIEVITTGIVSVRDTDVKIQNDVLRTAQVKTVLVNKKLPPKEEVELWIIIVSIIGGILLLLIILILLIKFGFFRREKREEMKRMIDDENHDLHSEETIDEPLNP